MINRQIKFEFTEYQTPDELTDIERDLLNAAVNAKQNAYAPYSKFRVGAAVLFDDNTIVIGSNQENASYPVGLCAERVALSYANSQFPNKKILKIAITGGHDDTLTKRPLTPCGICRQTIIESENRQGYPIELLLIGESTIWKINPSSTMLPLSFIADSMD